MWLLKRIRLFKTPRTDATLLVGRAFRPADSVQTAMVDGKTTVLDMDRDRYFNLDDIGSAIWDLVQEQRTFEQIVDGLQKFYDAPRAELEKDVILFLTQLRNHELVVET